MRLFNKQSGFTLIELIVIIAILAVFAGIAVPNFLSYIPKSRLNGAARQVMGDLMAARMKAVKENNRFRVFFLSDNHHYKILDDDNNNNAEDSGEWTNIKDIQSEYSDVTFSATADPIFYPRGTAYGTTIILTNSAGSTKDVKVHITGRVKIE
ncbi:MAG: type IV fimbrial biogenesis protein FimT [Desulfobacteraceae bacterium Eth-SRB1]|nr:MAG: type IV fimbrial biogenesis protein FimT [Desulfobacteraceae bacterium Eth-SRB1]